MSLIANNGGLLWNFLRGVAEAAAGKPVERLAESPRRATMWADAPEADYAPHAEYDADRAPLSPAVLASGVFVAAMIEEDAERWDGLA